MADLVLIGSARLSRSHFQIKNVLNSYRAGAHCNLITLDLSALYSVGWRGGEPEIGTWCGDGETDIGGPGMENGEKLRLGFRGRSEGEVEIGWGTKVERGIAEDWGLGKREGDIEIGGRGERGGGLRLGTGWR